MALTKCLSIYLQARKNFHWIVLSIISVFIVFFLFFLFFFFSSQKRRFPVVPERSLSLHITRPDGRKVNVEKSQNQNFQFLKFFFAWKFSKTGEEILELNEFEPKTAKFDGFSHLLLPPTSLKRILTNRTKMCITVKLSYYQYWYTVELY